MTTTEAYIKDRGREGQAPRQIFKGERRRAVASLFAEGLSHRAIAERLGIGKSTVARDLKWLKTSEHMLRAKEAAPAVVEEQKFDIKAMRDDEMHSVAALVKAGNTYEEIGKKLGISVRTVIRHVNKYLEQYGDWGGRTLQHWRNEQLVDLYDVMKRARNDMDTQPIRASDAMGDDNSWDLTPFQAAKIRSDARKDYMSAQTAQAKLLQLLVQRVEVDREERVVVMNLRNVDLGAFPKQGSPVVIDG